MPVNKDPRAQGKIVQYSWQAVQDASDKYCCYCLNEKQVETLLTMTIYLGWLTRWSPDATGVMPSQDYIDAFQAELEWRLMNPCCDGDVLTRFTVDGIMEISIDGGQTWTPAGPDQDPRLAAPIAPPLPGDDGSEKRCNAAQAGVNLIEAQADQLIADAQAWASIETLLAAFVALFLWLLGTTGPAALILGPLLFALVIALQFAGSAALDAALTEQVYDRLLCNLYCNMADDASFDETAWQNVLARISVDESGLAETFLRLAVLGLGAAGLTNAVRSDPTAVGDCSACECAGCGVENVWAFNNETATWYHPPVTGENRVLIESFFAAAGNRHGTRVRFGSTTLETTSCCDVDGSEDYTGEPFNIAFTRDCDLNQSSHANPAPAGCWREMEVLGNVGNPTGFSFVLVLGTAEC